ncbi:HAAS signaling domain-containing protein [Sporosarcina sp. FSL K6-3457]|uniref:HAAS signaling domain-containing protein n=1 Tax=Sporosarcina sp. FSL K6-3457 TaxID=2978204 RepID=UPI0030F5F61F
MELIEVYVREVTRRLPEKMRNDIALELRSTIEDMLPDDYTEDNVKQALEKLGNPITLAAQYRDQPMHLIGPKFYDTYISILKLTLTIVSTVVLSLFIIEKIASLSNVETLSLFSVVGFIVEAIGLLLRTAILDFFCVTIVFIILDRTISPTIHVPLTLSGIPWKPDDLKNIPNIPLKKAIKIGEIGAGFIWTIIWAIFYFKATHLIGVYESREGQGGLEFVMPVFQHDVLFSYWPLVSLLILLELLLLTYKAKIRQWTFKLAISNTIVQLIGVIGFIIIVSNSNLVNPEFVTYFSQLLDNSQDNLSSALSWVYGIIIASVIVTSLIDCYSGFRKAKIK